ncbi:MAG: peptidoglycan DD-metalloendopeptidase family protein [Burkholderiales bacterium]|nr:peptidoglycan DD-metalloendopeptidase family protein [Burkholderiales bacterium]
MNIQSIPTRRRRLWSFAAAAGCAAMLLLQGCTSTPTRAPVEDRRPPAIAHPPAAAASASEPAKPLPGAENAGKPGYYTVKPGDTLIRVALENGQNWRDIVRWNSLSNPDRIEVGQVLRVVPPGLEPNANGVLVRPVAPVGRVETRTLDGKPVAGAAAASAPASAASGATAAAPPREGDEDINWMWPAMGTIGAGFDEAKNKGIDILGKAGDPVLAAADGRVVYAGAGLRGLGNLVIVKHNASFLSAYAHNQTLLVKEDQIVHRGQKIAEMGDTEADRVELHFEIRRQGKPVDPLKLLPPR